MIYFLPIEIEDRKFHVLHLSSAIDADTVQHSFVLNTSKHEKKLFSILSETKLVSDKGIKDDCDIDWQSTAIEIDNATITVKLYEKKQITPTQQDTYKGTFFFSKDEIDRNKIISYALWRAENQADCQSVTVRFEFHKNNQTFQTSILLHIAPSAQIADIILDFGSEASQIVVRKRNDTGATINNLDIIGRLKNNFYPAEYSNNALNQETEDKDNGNLFKSIFFVQQDGDGVLCLSGKPNTNSNEMVKFLTMRKEQGSLLKENKHYIISNMKLADLGMLASTDITFNEIAKSTDAIRKRTKQTSEFINDLYHKIIFNFLHAATVNIAERADMYLHITLLVPNVFTQEKVTALKKVIQTEWAYFMENSQNTHLKGIEISIISESDASFLGYATRIQPNKKYLVIDAGKGTTDFSIIEYINNKQILSLYRSGFVGAGNVISYAIADTLMSGILADNNNGKLYTPKFRKNFIHKVLYDNAPLTEKLTFIEYIEQLKKTFDTATKWSKSIITDSGKQANANNLQLSSLNEEVEKFVASGYTLSDRFGFISGATDMIAQLLEAQVKQSSLDFDEIILAGRAFHFQQLRKSIETRFAGKRVNIVNNLKQICLQGAFSGTSINYNSGMVGMPLAIDNSKVHNKIEQTNETPNVQKNKILDNFVSKISTIGDFFTDNKTATNAFKVDTNFLINGKKLENYNPETHHILISGNTYKLKNNLVIERGKPVMVFFTGNTFYLRTENSCSELTLLPTVNDSHKSLFLNETLFPFNNVSSDNIPLNKLNITQ